MGACQQAHTREARSRRGALLALSLGILMIMLDTSIVNVALPAIREDLLFTDASLIWVVNAYLLSFGGSLLLSGRISDSFGHRRSFLVGLMLFTSSSLACGLAPARDVLVGARVLEGIGAGTVITAGQGLVMKLFSDAAERARAVGVYGFASAAGGTIGLLAGALLMNALGWRGVFAANVPLGLAAVALISVRGFSDEASSVRGRVVARESVPLVPWSILRSKSFMACNAIYALYGAARTVWFFFATLYMQRVLGKDPMAVAFGLLPLNLIMAVFLLWLSARLVMQFGARKLVATGMLLCTVGLALFARVPVDGRMLADVFPGVTLLGLGTGIAFNPLMLAAMSDVDSRRSGLASGLFNTASLVGSSVGLTLLATLSSNRTSVLLGAGADDLVALTAGYHLAFLLSACLTALATLLAAIFLHATAREMSLDEDRGGEPRRHA